MRTLACVLVATTALLAKAQQNPPVFRAGVDLVTVDVAVIDKTGKPVTGLIARDFSIVADKRPRRILTAEYVSAVAARAPTLAPGRPHAFFPAPTTNTPPSGRTFLFAVDVEQIAQDNGRSALKGISDYLDRLSPDDRVGLVSLPTYSPRVDLTTNRALVRQAAGLIVGASVRNQNDTMTVGEAAAIERLDSSALTDYLERTRQGCNDLNVPGLLPPEPALACTLRWQPLAVKVMDRERLHTRNVFDTLRALAASMAPIEGPKSLVLVSQGIVNDRETTDNLRRFAEAAEKARVTLYALNLSPSLADTSGQYNMMTARTRDHQTLLDGMATLAIAGRGDVFVVSGSPVGALARVDAEMSGYYLLSFERDPSDRAGQRAAIQVSVNWPDATVRARTEFTPDKPSAPKKLAIPANLKTAIGDLLRSPVPTAELAIDVDAYAAPALTGASDLRTLIAAGLGSDGRAIVAAGFEVTDESGKIVADGYEPQGKGAVSTQSLSGGQMLYLAGLVIPSGHYRVKVAAVDASGRRGSVEHGFDVRTPSAGTLRLSDVFFGEVTPNGFLPRPSAAPASTALPLRVEVNAGAGSEFSGATMTLELARAGDLSPLAVSPLSWAETTDARHRLASATLAIGSLPPGEYVVTAVLRTADGATARSARQLTKK